MDKNVNLDIIRVFAAWMVLSIHIGQYSAVNFSVGARGVELFFVLSGYLAFSSLDRNSSAIAYYKKRLIRIIPAYWTCLIIIYMKDIIMGIFTGSLSDALAGQCGPRYLRYFFFWQCFFPTDNWNLWNNHSSLWTMSVFAGFYILAPHLYKIMNRFYKSMVILVVFLFSRHYLVFWIQNIFSGYPEDAHIEWFADMNPLTKLYCFLLGAVLFVAIKEKKQNLYLIMVSITLIVTALHWYQYELLFVLLIAIAVLSDSVTKKRKVCKWISMISGSSFSLYLLHPVVLDVAMIIRKEIIFDNWWLHMLYLYVLCIGTTFMLYYGVIIKIEKWASNKLDNSILLNEKV